MKDQKRGRRIAMTPEEVDAFLTGERTCRVATAGADGRPHVVPLWFAWDGECLWLWSITRSQRWTDLARDPRVAVVVDTGEQYGELRGVEISGTAEPVGPAPRPVDAGDPETAAVERLFSRKYAGTDTFGADGRHGWLRVRPEKLVSWDFRKIPG
jgi:PPOX class probable F420-dependent enzyme